MPDCWAAAGEFMPSIHQSELAGVPQLFAVAGEQYLPMVDAVTDAAERHLVVGLLRRAADQA